MRCLAFPSSIGNIRLPLLLVRVPVPHLCQFTHFFSENPGVAFGYKNMRLPWDPFGSCVTLPSTSPRSDVDPKFDVETVSDEGTLVDTRRCPSHPDKTESISLSDVPEDEECIKSQCTPRGSPTCSENPFSSAGQPIVYPLPSDEGLLAYKPPPAITIDTLVAPPSCVHALTPPPTHYKRRRARIISDEHDEPELDQTPARCVCVISILAVRQLLITPETDSVPKPRAHCDSCSEPQLTPDSLRPGGWVENY